MQGRNTARKCHPQPIAMNRPGGMPKWLADLAAAVILQAVDDFNHGPANIAKAQAALDRAKVKRDHNYCRCALDRAIERNEAYETAREFLFSACCESVILRAYWFSILGASVPDVGHIWRVVNYLKSHPHRLIVASTELATVAQVV